MFIEQVPWLLRWDRASLWRYSRHEKKVYLSFDDGPIPEVTPWVLDLLGRYGIKATFFCVGENVSRHPELYARILQEGHRTGNHTYNHLKGYHTSCREFIDNVEQAARYIDSPLLRLPHGFAPFPLRRRLKQHYRLVFWDVVSRDYNAALSPQQVLGIACRYVRNGSIVVFHDSLKAEKNLRGALPDFIDYCLSQGYTFELIH